MAAPAMFTNLYWRLWGGKNQESTIIPTSSINSSVDLTLGLRELESIKFSSGSNLNIRSKSRRSKRKWHSREERRVDMEYDVVLVPSDGVYCLSGSESDDSDWSTGWVEPHAPEFQSNDEMDSGFAVLVPCYGNNGPTKVVHSSKDQISGAIADFTNAFSPERNGFLEQWLSSLQTS